MSGYKQSQLWQSRQALTFGCELHHANTTKSENLHLQVLSIYIFKYINIIYIQKIINQMTWQSNITTENAIYGLWVEGLA